MTGKQLQIKRAVKQLALAANQMIADMESSNPAQINNRIDYWHAVLKERMRLISYEKRQEKSLSKIKSNSI